MTGLFALIVPGALMIGQLFQPCRESGWLSDRVNRSDYFFKDFLNDIFRQCFIVRFRKGNTVHFIPERFIQFSDSLPAACLCPLNPINQFIVFHIIFLRIVT